MAITGKVNNGIATITKATENATLTIDSTLQATVSADGAISSDVKTIDASKVAAKFGIDFTAVQSQVTSVVGGKGGDTFTNLNNITTGAGADTIQIAEANTGAVVSDYDGTKDIITLTTDDQAAKITGEVSGKNVVLSFGEDSDKGSITLTNAKDSKIVINDASGNTIFEQSFQASANSTTFTEYDADDKNTGAVLTSNAALIDASGRKKNDLEIHATTADAEVIGGAKNDVIYAEDDNQSIDGGAGNDTIYAYANTGVQTLTGGKGNNVFVIGENSGNVVITDFVVGDGAKTGSAIALNGVDLTFDSAKSATNTAVFKYTVNETDYKVSVVGGLWNQVKPAKAKSAIRFTDMTGTVNAEKSIAYTDPSTVVVTGTIPKTLASAIDLGSADITGDTATGLTLGNAVVTKDATTVDFSNVSTALNISNGSNQKRIVGGKGKDTIQGSSENSSTQSVDTSNISTDTSTIETADSGIFVTVTENYQDGEGRFTISIKVPTATGGYTIDKIKVGVGYRTVSGADNIYQINFIDPDEDNVYTYDLGFKEDDTSTTVFTSLTNFVTYLNEIYTGSDAAEITYTNALLIDGGAGNDYLYGTNSSLSGGAGNDTLRSSAGGGSTLTGGAGNDVFLLSGADESSLGNNNVVIADYYAGTAKTTKASLGSDKIVVVWDKYNVKNTEGDTGAARASIVGSSADDNGVTLTITGKGWKSNTGTITNGTKTATVGAFEGTEGTSYFTLSNGMDSTDAVNLTEQGITYVQVINGSAANNGAATVNSNWLGYLDPNATSVSAAGAKKGQRIDTHGVGTYSTEDDSSADEGDIDGNIFTASSIAVSGSAKADTLIGNGKAQLTGGKGNDLFFVEAGDTVVDYSTDAKGNGKDVIVVDDLKNINDVDLEDDDNIVIKQGKTENKTLTGSYTAAGEAVAKVTVTINGTEYILSLNVQGTALATSGQPEGVTIPDDTSGLSFVVDEVTYTIDSLSGLADGASVTINYVEGSDKVGDITLNSTTGKAITFNSFSTQLSTNAKTGLISEKSVKSTMVRTFGTGASDSVVTFKGSDGDYLKVFEGETNARTINAKAAKAITLDNNATGVDSIVASGKADIIYTGSVYREAEVDEDENIVTPAVDTITLQSGNGNDIIIAEDNVVVTDFTGAAVNNKGKLTKGDAIVVNASSLNFDTATNKGQVVWDGNDVIITDDNSKKIRLVNAKDSNAIILTADQYANGYSITDTVDVEATDNKIYYNLANPNEYLITKAANAYVATSVKGSSDDHPTYIVNGSAATKALNIELPSGAAVTEIITGGGADTITATSTVEKIDAGKGNDIIDLRASTATAVDVTTGAGNDVIQISGDTKAVITDYTAGGDKIYFGNGYSGAVDDNYITSVEALNEHDVTVGSGKKASVTKAYDFTFTLDNGGTVVLADQLAGAKTTVILDTVTSAKANTFALDYVTEGTISIGNSDGATIDLKGVTASTIDLEQKRTKAITFINTGSSKTVQATGSKSGAAVTFIGNVASDSSENAYIEKNAIQSGSTEQDEENENEYTFTFNKTIVTITTSTDDESNVTISKVEYGTSEVKANDDGTYTIGGYNMTFTYNEDNSTVDYSYNDGTGPSTEGYEEAIYIGGAKTDVYIGGGYADTVNLGAGNDTVGQKDGTTANKATIQLGSGKDIAIVNAGDDYTIEDYKAGDDKFILDSALTITDANVENGTLTINFADEEDATATVKLTGYSGDKVTIAQFGLSANGKKVTTDNILQQSFGQEKITIVDADASANATISTSLDSSENTNTIDASATKKAHVLVGDGNVNSIIGGAGNDTVVITNEGTYTGGKGVDLFQISLSGSEVGEEEEETTTETPTVTITDFNTGNDILDVSGLALADYDTNYTLGASDATITTESVNIVLKDVVKNGVTSAIRYNSEDTSTAKSGVTLSDKTNIVLTAKSTTNDFSNEQFTNNTLTINASKSTIASALSFTAGANFTDYTAGKGGSNVDLTGSTKKVNVVTGAGADNITLGSAGANVTVGGGGDDSISGVTSNASFALAKGWTISNVAELGDIEEGTFKVDSVTLTLKKGSTTQSVSLTGDESAELFTLTKTVTTGSANKNNKATETTTLTLSGLGLTYTSSSNQTIDVPTDEGEYREAGFAELVSDDNFATASDLDNITAVKADDAAVAVDYSDLTSINNSTDFTQVTTAATKKQNK